MAGEKEGDEQKNPIKADDVAKPLDQVKDLDKDLYNDLYNQVRARAKMMEQYMKTGDVEGYKNSHKGHHPIHSALYGIGFIGFGFLWQISFFFTLYLLGLLIALGLPVLKQGRPRNTKVSDLKSHIRHDILKHPTFYILGGLVTFLAFRSAGHTVPMGEWSITDLAITALQSYVAG